MMCFLSTGLVYCQNDTIRMDLNGTIHLIFESNILQADDGRGKYIDPDSGEEVFDFAKDIIGNRLKITPLLEYFESTNLFVESEDGYYNFILVYGKPNQFVHDIELDAAISKKSNRSTSTTHTVGNENSRGNSYQDKELYQISHKITKIEGPILTGEDTQNIRLWVDGIFVSGSSDKLFISIKIENKGNIVYDWGYTGFFVRAKGNKTMKNEVVQEEEIKPIYTFNEAIEKVEGKEEVSKVFVFNKFTIEQKKVLSIELWESQGDRKILLELSSKDLLSAERI